MMTISAFARTCVVAISLITLSSCGGGPNVGEAGPSAGDGIDVRVSAGAPVAGAMVTVYAVDDGGEQNTLAGDRGVLGRGGPTDADGRAVVRVTVAGYSGPIQVVAGGAGLSYVDPTVPAPTDGSAPRVVQIPATFSMSSFVPQYRTGTPTVVPVTLLTTLADHAALAFARGKHPLHPQTIPLRDALSARDGLFVKHITASASAWSPSALRATVPSALMKGPQTLVDTAYAALTDVALNQLARDVAVQAGYGTDAQNAVNAITLVQLLNQDLDADGRLDGKADGGRAIAVTGTTPVGVDSLFLRRSLAQSLDGWMRNRTLNKSGISTADLAAAQVYLSVSTDTSDLFGDGPVQPFDPLDHDAPIVSLADGTTSTTIYTNQSTVTLRVRANDRSGVKRAFAQVGTTTYSGASQPDGIWAIQVPLPVIGHNPVTVWADDLADPGPNSGLGVPGHQLALDVLYDPTPPAVSYDSDFASYADERGMTVAADANGRAVLPASYVLSRGKAAVPSSGEIFKAATRLGGGTPDVAELESTNAANIPVLRFVVPFNTDTEAPIVQADYTVTLACSGCPALPISTGALLPSATVRPGVALYDLPVAAENVPALRSLVGPGALSVSLALKDAAGNATTAGPFAFTFHVVGPPLAIAEDPAYATYRDPWNTHPYSVANSTYMQLWDPGHFSGRNVRLLRYVVTNPAPEPVALTVTYQQAAGGSWKTIESWPAYSFREPGGQYLDDFNSGTLFTLDGFTYMQYLKWAYPYGSSGAGIQPPKAETSPWPCALSYEQGGNVAHRIGDTANRFVCAPSTVLYFPRADDVETTAFAVGDVTPELYGEYSANGGESLQPALDTTGQMAIIPAATAAGPGVAVFYLTRSSWLGRSRPLSWGRGSGAARYETWEWQIWDRYWKWAYGYWAYHTFMAYRWGRYLSASTETIDGSLSAATRGVSSSASLIGEPLGVFSSLQRSRTVATH